MFLLRYPAVMICALRRVREYLIRHIDQRHHPFSVSTAWMPIRMVFLRQGFVGGADHLGRRILRDLEVVVVGVDRPQIKISS